jgi:hypothetical protein
MSGDQDTAARQTMPTGLGNHVTNCFLTMVPILIGPFLDTEFKPTRANISHPYDSGLIAVARRRPEYDDRVMKPVLQPHTVPLIPLTLANVHVASLRDDIGANAMILGIPKTRTGAKSRCRSVVYCEIKTRAAIACRAVVSRRWARAKNKGCSDDDAADDALRFSRTMRVHDISPFWCAHTLFLVIIEKEL